MFTIYTTKTMPKYYILYKKIGKNGVCTLPHKNMAAIQSDCRHANKHNNYERVSVAAKRVANPTIQFLLFSLVQMSNNFLRNSYCRVELFYYPKNHILRP